MGFFDGSHIFRDEKIRYQAIKKILSSFGLTILTPRLLQIIMSQVSPLSVISSLLPYKDSRDMWRQKGPAISRTNRSKP